IFAVAQKVFCRLTGLSIRRDASDLWPIVAQERMHSSSGDSMNILLINGAKAFAHSGGRYNDTLHELARGELAEMGHVIQETRVDDGYDTEAEVDKFLWADVVIYQMPGWWMGAPWTVKKYIDEVFTAGHGKL